MFWTSFLVATPLLMQGAASAPTPHIKKRSEVQLLVRNVEATRDAAPFEVTSNILSLKSTGVKAAGSSALHNALRVATTDLLPSEEGAGYAIDINFGGKTFEVIFDTGSSDLWLAEQGVQCVDVNKKPVATAECGFGPLASKTFQDGNIANENFNITYGDGEFLTGVLGYENVGIAGVTVDKQEVALVDYAYWVGDNITSGLIGFAYPSLTSAFEGTNPAVDNQNSTLVPYTNWVFNAINQGLISSSFSIAIERGSNGGGGQLALGGLPSISFDHIFTSVPLQIMELVPDSGAASNYSFYTIIPDGFLLRGEEETYYGYRNINESPSTTFPVIVDSGTTLVYLPEDVAAAVNALYDPPSVYIEEEGVYENYCDATPPTFAIRIGGKDFYISNEELLLTGQAGYDPATDIRYVLTLMPGGCISGIQPSTGPYILGDVFLKNVVAVFDIGASEMRFAPHEKY